MLALGARIIGEEVALDILGAFLSTPYEGGRHDKRIAKLTVHQPAEPRKMNHPILAPSFDRFFNGTLEDTDPEVAAAIGQELAREQDGIELIASENIVSRAVLQAQGSVLTNKYAEGYPGRRYYGGCGPADIAETLAIERAKTLFSAGFANVQPNSGSPGQPGGVPGAAQTQVTPSSACRWTPAAT